MTKISELTGLEAEQVIPLTQGLYAIVDANDYEWLNQWKWYACVVHGIAYARRSKRKSDDFKQNNVSMHRQIMGVDSPFIDHRNGNGLDNRRSNLRHATVLQNTVNVHKKPKGKSKYRGVTFDKKCPNRPWTAQISDNKKHKHLGQYATQEEAAKVYDKEAFRLHGEFTYLNFPEVLHENSK